MSKPFKYLIIFLSVIFGQILILNNINIGGYINPYIYPLFILLLPLKTPKWTLIILGFILGLTIDIFSGSLGMHAAATTAMGFFRPGIITITSERNIENYEEIGINHQGFRWFITYVSALILLHHLIYFFIEIGNFYSPLTVLLRIFLSSVFSILIILFIEILFSSDRRKKYQW